MQTVETPSEQVQAAQGDPNEINDADKLAEATLGMFAGGRNFDQLSEQQRATFEQLVKAQESKPEEIPEVQAEIETRPPEANLEVEIPKTEETKLEPETAAASKREKFRFSNAEDKAIAQLAVAKQITLAKAAELYAKFNEPEPKPEVVQSEPVAIVASPTVKALENEVTALEAQMDGFVDGIYTAESIKVTRDHARKVAQLERAKMEQEQTEQANATFETQRENAMTETVKAFPDMANRQSAQYLVAARLADEAANPKHPDYKAACSMDAPQFFAQKAADLLKLKPAPAATVKTPVAAKTPTKPSPASGNRQTQGATREKSEADQLAEKLSNTYDIIAGGRRGEQTHTILIN